MKFRYIYAVLAPALLLGACSAENPFDDGKETKEPGQFAKSALDLDVRVDEVIHQSRAEGFSIDDFDIEFFNAETGGSVGKYKYGEMPEIVELPAGSYRVNASYGSNPSAAWESPWYVGDSDEFAVKAKEITTNIGTVKCKLSNLKTTIVFDPVLKNAMADDAYVEVKINENSTNSLKFMKEHDAGVAATAKAGYFSVSGESTLVATFYGNVNGALTSETKTLANVSAGNHYRITFKLHDHNGENSGNAEGNVTIDASVTVTDIDRNVKLMEDEILPDNERPKEDPIEDPENPENPDEPVTPVVNGPVVTAPSSDSDVILSDWNDVVEGFRCVLFVHTDSKISKFLVTIESEQLNSDVLESANLAKSFDLVSGLGYLENGSTKDVAADLSDPAIGLPVKEDVTGVKDVRFDVSGLMPLLGLYGAGDHRFILEIQDESGTTKVELKLRTL